MAESNSKQQDLNALERQWIHKALITQRDALTRSRQKEMPGSEIHKLRGNEIEQLTALANKFA